MQNTAETPSLRRRWEEYRLTTTQTSWIAVGAIIATLVIGFGPAGWVTGGTAQKMAADAASDARQTLASSVCVEEFMRGANAGARLEKIKQANWYERGELVGKWATMPDEKEPSSTVASMCAEKLAALEKPSAAKAVPAAVNDAASK
jgi:hypothetical protein